MEKNQVWSAIVYSGWLSSRGLRGYFICFNMNERPAGKFSPFSFGWLLDLTFISLVGKRQRALAYTDQNKNFLQRANKSFMPRRMTLSKVDSEVPSFETWIGREIKEWADWQTWQTRHYFYLVLLFLLRRRGSLVELSTSLVSNHHNLRVACSSHAGYPV